MKTILAFSFFAAAIFLLAGCGGSGAPRTRVKGTADYEGTPISQGVIYINADTGRKNEGPQGYAEIIDGRFDTSAKGGKGATPGFVIVRVEAFDGKADEERPKGKMLFAYETRTELAKGDAPLDLKIKKTDVMKTGSSGAQTGP